jgi:hypothetical protein
MLSGLPGVHALVLSMLVALADVEPQSQPGITASPTVGSDGVLTTTLAGTGEVGAADSPACSGPGMCDPSCVVDPSIVTALPGLGHAWDALCVLSVESLLPGGCLPQGALSPDACAAVQTALLTLSPDSIIVCAFGSTGAEAAEREFARTRELCTQRLLGDALALHSAEMGRATAVQAVASLCLEAADDLASLHSFLQVGGCE